MAPTHQMKIWIRASVVVLAAVELAAQAASGEIAGRLTDKQQGVLPGVRVRVSSGDQSREAVTDSEGRFSLPSLTFGTYRVEAELAGFKTVSGTIAISAATPIAFLAWSMELDCLSIVDRVILGPKGAAPLADAIVHVRVAGPARSALISRAPLCPGRALREYSVEVLDGVSGRGRERSGQRRMFVEPRGTELVVGHEYLALLWFDGSTSDDLVLPIASGRVVSKEAGDLNGLSPRAALDILAKWSETRRR